MGRERVRKSVRADELLNPGIESRLPHRALYGLLAQAVATALSGSRVLRELIDGKDAAELWRRRKRQGEST